MATSIRSPLSSLDPNFPSSSIFRPQLHFARAYFPSPSLPILLTLDLSTAPYSQFRPKPRLGCNSYSLAKPTYPVFSHHRCFRCGVCGHLAKSCRNPVRCFLCCGFIYKSFRCFKKSSKGPEPAKASDASGSLLINRCLLPEDRMDVMLPDLDVIRCCVGFTDPKPDSDTTSGMGSSLAGSSIPDAQQSPCSPEADLPESIRQIQKSLNREFQTMEDCPIVKECYDPEDCTELSTRELEILDLSLVRLEDFIDCEIFDDFVDYYSDEEGNSGPISALNPDSKCSVEDSMKDGKAVSCPMEINQFIIYCRIQAVDGFNRLLRAKSRGSKRVSPFRSNDETKKSCYIECLRESGLPPKMVAPVSRHRPVAVAKKKGVVKPFHGLVIPGNVRRSPRLNKGLARLV